MRASPPKSALGAVTKKIKVQKKSRPFCFRCKFCTLCSPSQLLAAAAAQKLARLSRSSCKARVLEVLPPQNCWQRRTHAAAAPCSTAVSMSQLSDKEVVEGFWSTEVLQRQKARQDALWSFVPACVRHRIKRSRAAWQCRQLHERLMCLS